MKPTSPLEFATLSRMAFGYATSQILYAAVATGVPDALADGPRPARELARRLECDADGMARLLRALVVLGVVKEAGPGLLALADLGRPLCAGHPRSIRSSVLLLGDPVPWQAWGALAHSARTGETAFDHSHGQPLFGYLAGDPGLSAVFNAAMQDGTDQVAAEVPKRHDFARARTVVDIGGGNGALLAGVLSAAPQAHGILFDTAAGAAGAAGALLEAGLAGRCTIETGDFFRSVPAGDVLLVKGILHDWDDERCLRLLRNCRRSIAPDGQLLVLEPVVPNRLDTAEAAAAVMSDIAMLVYTGGRERNAGEFRALLAAGGFVLSAITPLTGSAVCILAADPA